MYGWWNRSIPLKVEGAASVLATAYVREGNATLIALASWSGEAEKVRLDLDLSGMGLDASSAKVVAPGIKSFNRIEHDVNIAQPGEAVTVTVPAYEGWLLLVSS